MANERLRTLLLMEFTLLSEKEAFERECVKALGSLDPDIGLLISGPSWQEVPDMFHNPTIDAVLASCRHMGREFYWGRDVWIRWTERAEANGWKQRPSDVYSSAYYAAYLSRIDAEARAIGATGTFAQCEPHGESIYKTLPPGDWFKKSGFQPWESKVVIDVINMARKMAPAATMAKPAGSSNRLHYGYATCWAAGQRLCTKADYCRTVADLQRVVRTPDDEPLQVHWWRSKLTSRHNANPEGKLTIPEWRAIDRAEIKSEYPEFLGCVIKAENDCMLAVLKELGEAAR